MTKEGAPYLDRKQSTPIFIDPLSPIVAQDWDTKFYDSGTIRSYQVEDIVVANLNASFINDTLQASDPTYKGTFDAAIATLIQQGRKCAVYRVSTLVEGKPHHFVFMMSKGERLNSEVNDDFNNLGNLRHALDERRLPPFVPQVYSSTERAGIAGFSVEYLPDHLEMNVPPVKFFATHAGIILPEFFMHPLTVPKGRDFNEKIVDSIMEMIKNSGVADRGKLILQSEDVVNSDFYRLMIKIQEEIISRLYIINRVTGCVPKEFSINAGDFMADPDKEDFDLRLITIRGGWESMPETSFPLWVTRHIEKGVEIEGIGAIEYTLFSKKTVQRGMAKGEATLQAA